MKGKKERKHTAKTFDNNDKLSIEQQLKTERPPIFPLFFFFVVVEAVQVAVTRVESTVKFSVGPFIYPSRPSLSDSPSPPLCVLTEVN